MPIYDIENPELRPPMKTADFLRCQKQLLMLMGPVCKMDLEAFVETLERGKLSLPPELGLIGDKVMGDVRELLDVARAALKFQRAIKHYRPDVATAASAGRFDIPGLR